MGRRPATDKEALFIYPVRTRVTATVYKRLEKMVAEGDCNSIGEAARRVLSGDKITIFYVDNSLHSPMQRLSEIRSELRSIGVNVNQVTRYFNASSTEDQKLLHSKGVLKEYHQVTARIDELLLIVSELAKKWLQK
ncbi:plasmid mobilization relaxosome protein MobC [Chitinophaga terrae (ex Kim and Jung 2007)]|nr:plasmid mobilization relaxosome protein MobC [Chitinophaga terrae (ex Kim and Jung 2007)]GEP93282.1 hypothetical protein CTE07_49270 [Chitinophaga terrae (ex Kim and Jung 2007)]